MRARSRWWPAALALAALSFACRTPEQAPVAASQDSSERDPSEGVVDAPAEPFSSFVPIPNVELTTQDGRTVHFYDDLVRGRTVVVQFFFVDCQGVCPISTAKLVAMRAELGERFGRDVSFLSITLDPEHDTPAVLAEHARSLGADHGWTFLTGAKDDIERLRRRLGVFDLDPVIDADRDQHAGVLVLGNDKKQRWTMKPAALPARTLCQAVLRLIEPS